MRISDAMAGVTRLCIETAPFIYFVERNPTYVDRIRAIFRLVDEGLITGISSVITLTEVLNKPIQRADKTVEKAYRDMLLNSQNLMLVPISIPIAERAAELRAKYNLKTPDALQVSVAIDSGCDAFLTNDFGMKRVGEIRILILDDLELDPTT